MPIFGRMITERSPISTAPTVDPGVRRYSPSASPVGAMLIDSFEVCRVVSSAAESRIGSLRTCSCRVISRIAVLFD